MASFSSFAPAGTEAPWLSGLQFTKPCSSPKTPWREHFTTSTPPLSRPTIPQMMSPPRTSILIKKSKELGQEGLVSVSFSFRHKERDCSSVEEHPLCMQFNLWYLHMGQCKNPPEILYVNLGNSELHGPVIWVSIRQLPLFLCLI